MTYYTATWTRASRPGSELQLQPCLIHARRKRARRLTEGGRVQHQTGIVQVDTVECVICIHAQQRRESLSDGELLHQRQVGFGKARTAVGVAPQVAIRAGHWCGKSGSWEDAGQKLLAVSAG